MPLNDLHSLEPNPSLYNRASSAAQRAKYEYFALTKNWDKHTFVADVFGPRKTWFVPEYEASEWGFILYLFHTHSVTRVLRLSITTVGSVLIPPLGVVLYTRFLFSSRGAEKVRYVGEKYAQRNKDADEDWWYLNGTGVNTDLQAANGYHVAEIFHKQVRLYYNPTTGLLFDLAQCAVGLVSCKTKPSSQLAKSIRARFKESPTVKVILVVHSMGSIITANAVKYMIRKGWTEDLHRLEIYTFGCPSIEFMHIISPKTLTRAPFYEHYANYEDYISKIGVLRIENNANWWAMGRVFTRHKQGHFFGEHYLPGISSREYKWHGSTEHSRLYSYLPPEPTPSPHRPSSPPPDYCYNPRRPRRHRYRLTTPPALPSPLADPSFPTSSTHPTPSSSLLLSSDSLPSPTLPSSLPTPSSVPPTSFPTRSYGGVPFAPTRHPMAASDSSYDVIVETSSLELVPPSVPIPGYLAYPAFLPPGVSVPSIHEPTIVIDHAIFYANKNKIFNNSNNYSNGDSNGKFSNNFSDISNFSEKNFNTPVSPPPLSTAPISNTTPITDKTSKNGAVPPNAEISKPSKNSKNLKNPTDAKNDKEHHFLQFFRRHSKSGIKETSKASNDILGNDKLSSPSPLSSSSLSPPIVVPLAHSPASPPRA